MPGDLFLLRYHASTDLFRTIEKPLHRLPAYHYQHRHKLLAKAQTASESRGWPVSRHDSEKAEDVR